MDDKIFLNSFFTVITECNKYNHAIDHDIETALDKFEKNLRKSSVIQINWLKDVYKNEIIKIKFTLSKLPALRSLHDKVFTKHLKYNKNIPTHVTNLFENFITGITYFRNEQEQAIPIYHRLYSCGPYENTYRQGNLVCTDDLSKKKLNRRKSLIERCYIERLIYNNLYIEESLHFPKTGVQENEQNEGHLFRMDLTKKDFESCFPNTKINIDIEYSDNFPFKLIINKINPKEELTLTYNKSFTIMANGNKIYEDAVECIKHDHKNNKKYIKTSRFGNPGKF